MDETTATDTDDTPKFSASFTGFTKHPLYWIEDG
jgi:hypothetical protein